MTTARRSRRRGPKLVHKNDGAAEITVFTKDGGPLTKRISLTEDGTIVSDGSECRMAHGQARRVKIADVARLAAVIGKLQSSQAIGLGALRHGLPDEVRIVTKNKLNGAERPGLIARTGDAIVYREGRPAFALLDFDTKGMPPEVATRLAALGEFWSALVAVLPVLGHASHLIRRSTSAGLWRTDTGDELAGSNGLHGSLHQRRPSGVPLHLDDPELVARGIDAFSRDTRPLAEGLQLPAFESGQRPLYPPPTVPLAALIAPVVQGDPRRYSGDWHTAMAEQQRAQRERQEREDAEQEAKVRENWHGPRWWEGERV